MHRSEASARGVWVDDVHSRCNRTRVARVARPTRPEQVAALVARAAERGAALSVSGARHAMGGQAFLRDRTLLDLRGLAAVTGFDAERGVLRIGAGASWTAVVAATRAASAPDRPWAIVQKQTGADDLTLGGAVAANAHGRVLTRPPLVGDVRALHVVDARGRLERVDRRTRPDLFALVVGGYGLFGVVTEVELALTPRRRVRRRVVVRETSGLADAVAERVAGGALYGDFQPDVDPRSPWFLRRGVLATYAPCEGSSGSPDEARVRLSADDWRALLRLAHVDPTRAFERYAAHYLATDGQVYDSDTHQLATYLPDYHRALDRELGCRGSETITELYVPRPRIEAFLDDVRSTVVERGAQPIYATVRWIERDEESGLAWAREPWACLVLNLHLDHRPDALQRAGDDLRALIDVALAHGGSFFLTYHRLATARQLRAAHPGLDTFRAEKLRRDPERRFDSDWWRAVEATLCGAPPHELRGARQARPRRRPCA